MVHSFFKEFATRSSRFVGRPFCRVQDKNVSGRCENDRKIAGLKKLEGRPLKA